MHPIIRDGVVMVVMLFVLVILYLVLSTPFAIMFDTFDDINETHSDTHMEIQTSNSRIIFNFVFLALAVVNILWFIIRVFRNEPDRGFR